MNFLGGYGDRKTRLARFIILLWVMMYVSNHHTWVRDKNLVDNGIPAVGIVTRQAHDADTYHYYYEFTDQHGQRHDGHAGAYANTYTIGSRVPVKYLAEDPETSCVEPVRREKMYHDRLWANISSAILLVTLAFVLWRVPRKP